MTIRNKLEFIQKSLKAPKNNRNSFGNYNYRSCEDILEAVKPYLIECVIVINDELVEVGGRVYVKSTASIIDDENRIDVSAYAREPIAKRGMDDAQITGSTSSYARKYALNGLLLIDDSKDSDTQDNTQALTPEEQKHEARLATMRRAYNDNKESIDYIKSAIAANEPSSAAEAMAELDEDTRLALNVAPSKGGIWTFEEVNFFKSEAYAQARKDYFTLR